MSTSLVLALVPLVLGLVLAFVILVWAEDLGGWSKRKVRIVASSFALGGAVFAVYAYFVDFGLRRTTLFEVMIEDASVTRADGRLPVWEHEVTVESPGVEHELLYAPVARPARASLGTVGIRVEIIDPEGGLAHASEKRFEPYRSRGSAGRAGLKEWSGENRRFTPRLAGRHLLRVYPLTPDIPRIHVRIGDPTKRDGTRIPGY